MSNQHNRTNNERNIRLAFFLNFGFTIAEIIGGLMTNSVAILADALHDFGDSITLALSWRLEKVSEKGEDLRYSYGYKRFSLLGALIGALVLIGGAAVIVTEAVRRLRQPQAPNAPGMLAFAVAGILINGYAAIRAGKGKNMNTKMISWHLMEDALGWAAVLAVSIVLLFSDLYFLDPLLSILVTVFVLVNVMRNLRRTAALFLQGVPESLDLEAIEREMSELKMVSGVHHTHAWSLDGEQHVLTTHVILCPDADAQDVRAVKDKMRDLKNRFGLAHTTVEIEHSEEDCSMQVKMEGDKQVCHE
jgi:cobalt-zinc-cadmium efflux system protein